NMDVVRVLLEDIGVDINARSICGRQRHIIPGSDTRQVPDQTVLHVLARGSYSWQSTLALPYLIAKGADLDARDAAGLTPLLTALGRISVPSFDDCIVRKLVTHGADVNARDPRGRSCLGQAVSDRSIVQYLLEHGARVTFSAF